MYLKQDNIIVANKIEDIPIDDIKVGNQIMIFNKKKRENWYELEEENNSYSAVENNVVSKVKDNLYLFNSSTSFSDPYQDDENENVAELVIENNIYNLYLRIDNALHFIDSNERFYDLSANQVIFNKEDIEYDGDETSFKIYESIFKEQKELKLVSFKLETNENKYCQIVSFRLTAETFIVFEIAYQHNIKYKQFNAYRTVGIYTKDGKYYDLGGSNFDNIKLLLQKSKLFPSFVFETLNNIELTAEYNVKHYLDDIKKGNRKRYEEFVYSSLFIPSWEMRSLFKPIWINEELDLYFYLSSFNSFSSKLICYKGNIEENSEAEEIDLEELLKDSEFRDDFRIAKEIKRFYYDSNENGVSPHDGLYYKNGEIYKSTTDNYKVYEDFNALIYLTKSHYVEWNKVVYLKIKNHWVMFDSNLETDNSTLNEAYERIKVVHELSEGENKAINILLEYMEAEQRRGKKKKV